MIKIKQFITAVILYQLNEDSGSRFTILLRKKLLLVVHLSPYKILKQMGLGQASQTGQPLKADEGKNLNFQKQIGFPRVLLI